MNQYRESVLVLNNRMRAALIDTLANAIDSFREHALECAATGDAEGIRICNDLRAQFDQIRSFIEGTDTRQYIEDQAIASGDQDSGISILAIED